MDGEAKQAQAQAAMEWLEVYERSIKQGKEELDDRQQYIDELKKQRQELRQDRDELRQLNDGLRKKLTALEEKVMNLERDVARNGRMVEALRPFLCGRMDCKERVQVKMEKPTAKK